MENDGGVNDAKSGREKESEDENTGGVKNAGDRDRVGECGSEVEEGRVRHRGRAGAPTTRGEVFSGSELGRDR